jgi:hypothetical protein
MCAKSIQCGGTTCTTDQISSGAGDSANLCMPACCTAAQTCGVSVLTALTDNMTDVTCNKLNQPGIASEECGASAEESGSAGPMPTADDPLNFNVVYRCKPDNRCGIFIPNVGVGCAAFERDQDYQPAV